jgi:hypothetical protein
LVVERAAIDSDLGKLASSSRVIAMRHYHYHRRNTSSSSSTTTTTTTTTTATIVYEPVVLKGRSHGPADRTLRGPT